MAITNTCAECGEAIFRPSGDDAPEWKHVTRPDPVAVGSHAPVPASDEDDED